MKTAEDFKKSAIENKIYTWPIHNCSLCNYECGYLFFAYDNGEVVYDNGCDCTRRYIKSHRNWDDVANHYNIQKDERCIKKMNEFWKFNRRNKMTDTFRKEYRALSESQKSWLVSFKDQAETLNSTFESCLEALPELDKRMMALAKTNLEQSIMWAIKSIT